MAMRGTGSTFIQHPIGLLAVRIMSCFHSALKHFSPRHSFCQAGRLGVGGMPPPCFIANKKELDWLTSPTLKQRHEDSDLDENLSCHEAKQQGKDVANERQS